MILYAGTERDIGSIWPMKNIFQLALHLWAGRRRESILDYLVKSVEKELRQEKVNLIESIGSMHDLAHGLGFYWEISVISSQPHDLKALIIVIIFLCYESRGVPL